MNREDLAAGTVYALRRNVRETPAPVLLMDTAALWTNRPDPDGDSYARSNRTTPSSGQGARVQQHGLLVVRYTGWSALSSPHLDARAETLAGIRLPDELNSTTVIPFALGLPERTSLGLVHHRFLVGEWTPYIAEYRKHQAELRKSMNSAYARGKEVAADVMTAHRARCDRLDALGYDTVSNSVRIDPANGMVTLHVSAFERLIQIAEGQ